MNSIPKIARAKAPRKLTRAPSLKTLKKKDTELFETHNKHLKTRKDIAHNQKQTELTTHLSGLLTNQPGYGSNRFGKETSEFRKGKGSLSQGQAAAGVYNQSLLVEPNTGKNKIYIGNLDDLSDKINLKSTAKKRKKARAARLNSMSWGFKNPINSSFIQGGIEAGADFKIKHDVKKLFRKPLQSGEHLLGRIKRLHGPNKPKDEILYNQDKGYFTIFAIEMAQLVDNGYEFVEEPRKSDPSKTKQWLKKKIEQE